jgi:hypothetical protein
LREAVSIKKTICIFFIIAFFFAGCELTKRRYTGGWYISKPSAARNMAGTKKNECDLQKVSKQERIEVANIWNEKKAPEKTLDLSKFRELKTNKRALFTNKFKAKHEAVKKQNKIQQGYNNKAFLIAEYTTFGLSIASGALGFATLGSIVTLAIVCFALAIILFLISVLLSYIAIRKIRNLKLDHRITPHAIIIGITLGIFCLVVSGIVALIAALATGNPTIAFIAGAVTFLLLMIVALSKI